MTTCPFLTLDYTLPSPPHTRCQSRSLSCHLPLHLFQASVRETLARDPKDLVAVLKAVDSFVESRLAGKEELLANATHLYEQAWKLWRCDGVI